jgi:hypothetical protein
MSRYLHMWGEVSVNYNCDYFDSVCHRVSTILRPRLFYNCHYGAILYERGFSSSAGTSGGRFAIRITFVHFPATSVLICDLVPSPYVYSSCPLVFLISSCTCCFVVSPIYVLASTAHQLESSPLFLPICVRCRGSIRGFRMQIFSGCPIRRCIQLCSFFSSVPPQSSLISVVYSGFTGTKHSDPTLLPFTRTNTVTPLHLPAPSLIADWNRTRDLPICSTVPQPLRHREPPIWVYC